MNAWIKKNRASERERIRAHENLNKQSLKFCPDSQNSYQVILNTNENVKKKYFDSPNWKEVWKGKYKILPVTTSTNNLFGHKTMYWISLHHSVRTNEVIIKWSCKSRGKNFLGRFFRNW